MRATRMMRSARYALTLTLAAGSVAGASVCAAAQSTATTADAIYINGKVLTVDAGNRTAEAVAVRDGRIQAVGRKGEIEALAGPGTKVVDLQGKTMIPGFVDAHSHFLSTGAAAAFSVDLSSAPVGNVKNIDEIVARLKRKAESTPKGEWILGNGYDDTLVAEKRHPTRADLDRASTDHPIFIRHVSGHFAVANSKALELAQLTRNTPNPQGGEFRRDAAGELNGVLEETTALAPVAARIPALSREQNLEAIRKATEIYTAKGVTTAQDGAFGNPKLLPMLQDAAAQGQLQVRLVIWPTAPVAKALIDGKAEFHSPDPQLLKIGATKIFSDGSIQGYTGYLSEPYHVHAPGKDDSYRGYPTMPRDQLAALVLEQHKAGRQIAIHGNGDAAIDDILFAFSEAQKAFPRPDARHVIVHSQTARDDQLDKMKALGVIPSFFVLHTYYWGDRHRDVFLGPQRAMRISPLESALKRGVRFTIHTDTPVVPMDPLRLMWSAVNRISSSGKVIGAAERITATQALRAVTIDSAWQSFEEDSRGSIEPGKLADFAILSASPLDDPARIKDIQVFETIVGGKTLYSR
ncbi:amidohydrolase [Cupriavidus lacunae]|nr:amidohydrolase [Cupriavidus lacunae]